MICDATTAPPTVYASRDRGEQRRAPRGEVVQAGPLIFDARDSEPAVGRKMIEKTRTSWAKPATVARTFILTCGVSERLWTASAAINHALTCSKRESKLAV